MIVKYYNKKDFEDIRVNNRTGKENKEYRYHSPSVRVIN